MCAGHACHMVPQGGAGSTGGKNFSFLLSRELHSGQDTQISTSQEHKSAPNRNNKMIPQSESPALFETNFAGESHSGPEDCEQSRCGQSQTALEVYERIVRRLQSQQEDHASRVDEAAFMRQIWIASFTGSRLQYRM